MLGFEHPSRQRLSSVAGKHRHGSLCHNRAFIHLGAHEMYGAAADLAPRRDDALVAMKPSEGRKQRGVNIEVAVAPALNEARVEGEHVVGMTQVREQAPLFSPPFDEAL